MARLNDPPPQTESIESLKKRFIRQNRELAKTNSIQSIRIRNLESETSRLLTENLALRSEIAHLETTVADLHHSTGAGALHATRTLLEAKLAELSTLVGTLGQPDRVRHARRRSSYVPLAEKPSPTARQQWREETQMPTIMEGKSYPRRTMEASDMVALTEQAMEEERKRRASFGTGEGSSADSPDLGPPPVAHFDEVGPIGFDPQREVGGRSDGAVEKEEKLESKVLGVNLETRRRRRESGKLDVRRLTVFPEKDKGDGEIGDARKEPDATPVAQPTTRLGKRKFGVEDSEMAPRKEVSHSSSRDEFQFSRKSHTENPASLVSRELDDTEEATDPLRRALKDKSTNDDILNSPKKLRASLVDSKPMSKPTIAALTTRKPALSARETAARARLSAKSRDHTARDARAPNPSHSESITLSKSQRSRVSDTSAMDADVLPSTEQPFPPKTPSLPLDIFSPSTDASAPLARDTPPPAELGFPTTGRPSRRARPQVNYAEPSLVKKMRRPGEKVDAVVPTGSLTRDSSTSDTERRSASAEPVRRERKTLVKSEEAEDEWRALTDGAERTDGKTQLERLSEEGAVEQATAECRAASPLGRKVTPTRSKPVTAASTMLEAARKRRESASANKSSAAATTTTTTTTTRRVKATRFAETGEDGSERDPLSVFEFTDSSSPPRPLDTGMLRTGATTKTRESRRHSSVAGLGKTDKPEGTRPSSRTGRASSRVESEEGSRVATRRRSMMV